MSIPFKQFTLPCLLWSAHLLALFVHSVSYMSEIKGYLSSSICFILLSKNTLKFYSCCCQWNVSSFSFWIVFHCVYAYTHTHLHIFSPYILATLNTVVINLRVHAPLKISAFMFGNKYSGVEQLNHMIVPKNLGNLYFVFHCSCTNLNSHQRGTYAWTISL